MSGGEKNRAALLRVLCLDPEIIFLDEPTVGLDVMSTGEAYKGLSKMESTQRRTLDSDTFSKTFGLDPDSMFMGVFDYLGKVN